MLDANAIALAILSLVSAGLTVWGTASASYRSKVKEEVWRELFRKKRDAFHAVNNHIGSLNQLLNHLRNLDDDLWRRLAAPEQRVAILLEVVHERITASHKDALKLERYEAMRAKLAGSPPPDEAAVEGLRLAMSRHIVAELGAMATLLRREAMQARMVSFDPPVFDALAEAVRRVANATTAHQGTRPDFKTIDEVWFPARARIQDEMRLDMRYSARSFWRVTRVKPSWKRAYNRRAKEEERHRLPLPKLHPVPAIVED